MKKYVLSYMCLMLVALCTKAEPMQHNLVVQFCDAETLVFALTEKPIATLRADSLLIATGKFQAAYLRDEICDFYFLQAPRDTSNLSNQTIYISYMNDHIIRIHGVQKGDQIAMYSVGGNLLRTHAMKNDNAYVLHLSSYPRGMYLIQVQYYATAKNLKDYKRQHTISFKIIR